MESFGVKIDLAAYAMPMAVFGILFIYQKDKAIKGLGHVLLGVAFLFIGIQFIKEGFEALSQDVDLTRFAMTGIAGVLVFTGVGVLLTVVMQSSHAVLMLTIAALAAGQISYHNALALAIGTNVGTTVTAVLGALGSNVAGKRLAAAHMVFNLTTGAIAITFLAPLAAFVDTAAGWLGIAADDYTLKLALFHTVFNLLGVALMLPLIDRLVALLERRLPEKVVVDGVEQPQFLTDAVLDYPDAALVAMTRETQHLALNALEIIAAAVGLHARDITGDEPVETVVRRSRTVIDGRVKELYRTRIKSIYSAILDFASKAQPRMSPDQAAQLDKLRQASHHLVEAIKELRLIRKNIAFYMGSDNVHMREQYDVIRIHIGRLLRAIDELREVEDLDEIRAALTALRKAAKKDDVVKSGTLDKLIRDELITPTMASSLMNDNALGLSIQKHLLRAAETLFAMERNPDWQGAAELDRDEAAESVGRGEVAELLRRSRRIIDERIERYRGT
jgi:phosphate:Na+ symporter